MPARFRPLSLILLAPCVASVIALALAPATARAGPLAGRGMWIWYVAKSEGGDLAAIADRARSAGVRTLYVKAGDGPHVWSQFTRSLVRFMHARGLRVCAWQYVYGSDPLGEADVAARAVARGADCFAIDAETEYEGRYASARAYMRALRAAVGPRYPIALASFPYADFHPGFPFSVFLGPGGAQVDMPQMYWRDIGTTVGRVFRHTWRESRIYGRAIVPLGQTDNGASSEEARAFRGLTVRYGAPGIAWWDWAWASADGLWGGLSGFYTAASSIPSPGYPLLEAGSAGDQVVRLQELLARVYASQRVTGTFASQTAAHLARFQSAHRLAATGRTDAATWRVLLRLHPVVPAWGAAGAAADTGGAALPRGASGPGRRSGGAPVSAGLPARRVEIRPEPVRAEAS